MLATRARGVVLVVVVRNPIQDHCTGETSLSFGAAPCCDVPAAASNTQPAFKWHAHESATALASSREEAQHACLRRACAVPPWL